MRILYSTCSGANYMAPPVLADEQVNCGPFFRDREVAGRHVSLATPKGEYDLAAVAARLSAEQQPDAVVCLVDASWFNQPKNLAAFKCPRIALVADTHHMNRPITGMIRYLQTQPFDRIVFLYTRHHLEIFREAGLKNLFWFPGLTFPHSDAVVQAARRGERVNRIALIGQAGNLHQRRQRLAAALAAARLPLVFREAPQREALEFYGGSLLGFNATANSDLNLRVFEILASGAAMLMDRLAPESGMDALFRDGTDYVGYDSAEELVERARHYSAHPEEARRLGAAGAAWFDRYFHAAKRRADFTALAFDGRAVPLFNLPVPRKPTLLPGFGQDAGHFVAGLRFYEHLQLRHSTAERVLVQVDETVPPGLKALCATLPRIEVTRRPDAGEVPDFAVMSTARAQELATLDAPALWCWDAGAADVAALGARFKAAGLAQPAEDLACFEVPVAAAPVDRLAQDARKLLFNCDLTGAMSLARRALQENPQSLEAHLVMAELALEGGQPDLFAKMVARARALSPDEPRIPLLELGARQPEMRQRPAERLLSVALRHVSGADLGAAKAAAARALAVDPQLAAAWFWLGHVTLTLAERYTDVGRWREFGCGYKYLRTAAELAPHRPDYWLELAHALRQGGLLAEATRAFARALELDPANSGAWLCQGETLLRLDRVDEAAAALARGLEHAPSDSQLQLWLGHARKRQGRLAEALALHCAAHGAAAPAAPGQQRKVVFLIQHAPAWPCTESVWKAFAADPAWETEIVALPYTHPFYNRAQDDTNAIFGFLEQRRIPHVRWDRFRLEPGCADVMFVQNPYDVTRPEGWRLPDLLRAVPRLAYVPYGIEIGGGERNNTMVMNLPLQQVAWQLYARSERQRRAYADRCLAGNRHVVVTGHPKLDALHAPAAADTSVLTRFAAGRRLVAWNPHFDVRLNGTRFGNGFSTFLRWQDFLIEETVRRPGLALVLRPHPLFFGTLEDRGILTQAQVKEYLARCAASGSVLIDRDPSHLPLFAAADAMLSDVSSFVLEFCATGKPLLFLQNPHADPLNDDADFVYQHLYRAEREDEIRRFLDLVEAGEDPLGENRRRAYGEYMHRPAGGSGAAIKHAVERQLAAEAPAEAAAEELVAV